MNFMVFATVEKTTDMGNKYPFIVWGGEFCDSKYNETKAKRYARRKVKKTNPSLSKFTLVVEKVPDYHDYN